MTLVFDLIWLLLLVLGMPFFAWKVATTPRWRTGWLERFGFRLPVRPAATAERPLIWVHAVSVGEVLAARPLVRELERAFPDHEVAVSTITSTGREVARKHFPQNLVFLFPIDLSFAVRRVLDAIRPKLVVLVELELWPTFLSVAAGKGIPIVVVNGRISARSARRYRWVKGWITRGIARYCVQNEEYAERFRAGLGVPEGRVLITGNLKYDSPALEACADEDAAATAPALRARLGIAEDARVIVGGSTHPSEERALVEAWKALRAREPGLRLVVCPRHMERLGQVLGEIEAAGERCVRKTEMEAGAPPAHPERSGREAAAESKGGKAPVVIIDTMGELGRIYRIADVVFVGGSLIPHGGQNMLEPAALGKPVVFGPHTANFQAIADALAREGGAVRIDGAGALEGALGRLLAERAAAAQMGERGRAFVERHRGAAKRTAEVIAEVMGRAAGADAPAARGFREQHGSNTTTEIVRV